MNKTTICNCGQPTSGGWLCQDCTLTLSWSIVNVAAYYLDLETVLIKATRLGDSASKGSIGKVQPLPLDTRFSDVTGQGTQLRWDAWQTVVAWARTIMEDQPELHGPACTDCLHTSCSAIRRRRWPANRVTSMLHYLARQKPYILHEMWAQDILDEMTNLEGRLRRFTDRHRDKMYLGSCIAVIDGEECGGGVYATEGDDTGACDQEECAAIYDVTASRANLEEALDSRLCTAAEIARLSTYLGLRADRTRIRKRINQWHTRGRIVPQGHDEDGDPRFLYSAVRVLLYAEFSEQSTSA